MDQNVKIFVIAILIITPFLLILRSRIRIMKRMDDERADEKFDPLYMTGRGKYLDGEYLDEEYD